MVTKKLTPTPIYEGSVHRGAGLTTRLAASEADIRAAQTLRYNVFVSELGSDGPMVDHAHGLECDRFDSFADHLLLLDQDRPEGDQVVGVYRLMTREMARRAGQFYCADEYDLSALTKSDLGLLELGRSCLHPDYRGGNGMLHLWGALSRYISENQIDVMFGVASFHGTDVSDYQQALALLGQKYLAPPQLRVRAHGPTAMPLDQLDGDAFDRLVAVKQMPALVKAYLRLGAVVGEGAFIDHAFNTTDVCLILHKDAINTLQQSIYTQGGRP